MKSALLPLLMLLAACSSAPPRAPGQTAHEEPPAPAPRVKVIHIPAKPEPEEKSIPKADELCPPPSGPETEAQHIIRKLDCLLERD